MEFRLTLLTFLLTFLLTPAWASTATLLQSDGEAHRVLISWDANPPEEGVTSYSIYRSGDAAEWTQAGVTDAKLSTEFQDEVTSGLWYWHVRAHNSCGASEPSEYASLTIEPEPQDPWVYRSLTAFQTPTPVTVDGVMEETWAQAESVVFANAARSDNTAAVRALWDDANLYFLLQVTDAHLESGSTRVFRDDAIEIHIDVLHTASEKMDDDDRKFIVSIDGRTSVTPTGTPIVHQFAPVTGGYLMELAIAWSDLGANPGPDQVLGLLVSNNDKDNGASSQFDWGNLIESGSYSRTNLWGDLLLGSRPEPSPEPDPTPEPEPEPDDFLIRLQALKDKASEVRILSGQVRDAEEGIRAELQAMADSLPEGERKRIVRALQYLASAGRRGAEITVSENNAIEILIGLLLSSEEEP